MGLFKRKKDGYVDLGEKLRKQEEKLEKFQNNNFSEPVEEKPVVIPEPEQETQSGFMGFFGGNAQSSTDSEEPEESVSDEKKRKLKLILNGLSQRLDDQEKEIYNLKQKLEVIERKQNVGYR